ncbi:MAG: carbon-nitrogen hydrolase family protein [Kiloniellaceae bacterium]
MSAAFKVACIQNSAGPEIGPSMEEATRLVRAAHARGAELICLPEYFSCLKASDDQFVVGALAEAEHPAIPHYRALALKLSAWLLLGSLAIKAGPDRVFNRSYLIDPAGQIVARYDKLHLFDVDLEGGESYRESAAIAPGDRAVLAPTPWGPIGLTICYDLRFAYLYRALAQAGALFLAVPAAFAKTTGQAHWHVLVRSRAIETGCYVFAPCQCGTHGGGRPTYGHSLIVDPWGQVLADGGEEPGFVLAEVDPAEVAKARRMIPALDHDRAFAGPDSPAAAPLARRA